VIVPLLREGRVTFRGHHAAVDTVLRPRGPSGTGPPIWIGAKRPRMIRLAAKYTDSWNADWVAAPEQVAGLQRKLEIACEAVGRQPRTLSLTGQVRLQIVQSGEAINPDAHFAGKPGEIREVLLAYSATGLSHLTVDVLANGVPGVAAIDRLGSIWSAIG